MEALLKAFKSTEIFADELGSRDPDLLRALFEGFCEYQINYAALETTDLLALVPSFTVNGTLAVR